MKTGATISKCGKYRYLLWRIWNDDQKRLVFIMLNPSTADHTTDDPTIRRCMRFAASNGYGGIVVANLFAYRATKPADLPDNITALGPDNDEHLRKLANGTPIDCDVVFAWGTKGVLQNRDKQVLAMFPQAYCLELTKGGHPKHPLYVRADVKFSRFKQNHGPATI